MVSAMMRMLLVDESETEQWKRCSWFIGAEAADIQAAGH